MTQTLSIKSIDDKVYLLTDIYELFIEVNYFNNSTEPTYNLRADLLCCKCYDCGNIIIKYNCTIEYIGDFLFTLEDYAFN